MLAPPYPPPRLPLQLSPKIVDKLPSNMDDIDLRPSNTGGLSADDGEGARASACVSHHSLDIDFATPEATEALKKAAVRGKKQLVYAMLDTPLDVQLLTDALRTVLKANGAACARLLAALSYGWSGPRARQLQDAVWRNVLRPSLDCSGCSQHAQAK